MKHKLIYLTAIVATAGLTACSTSSNSISDTEKQAVHSTEQTLQAYHWDLVSTIDSKGDTTPAWISNDPDFNQPLSLSFTADRVAIQNLCNPLMAGYAVTERDIDFSQVASGMRMCADQQLMQYEQQVGQLLPTATDWSLAIADQNQANAPDPILTLHFENGESWRLKGEATAETKYGAPAEVVFLEVAPQPEVCPESGANCLKARYVNYDANGLKTGVGEWALFQPNAIEGYSHEPGVMSIVRVNRYPIKNAPADAAQYAYELDMVVEMGGNL